MPVWTSKDRHDRILEALDLLKVQGEVKYYMFDEPSGMFLIVVGSSPIKMSQEVASGFVSGLAISMLNRMSNNYKAVYPEHS